MDTKKDSVKTAEHHTIEQGEKPTRREATDETPVDPIDELLSDVPEWLKGPLKENYRQILATIAIIVIVTVLWSGFSYYNNTRERAASYRFSMAMAEKGVDARIKALKTVIDQYGHTSAAKMALLMLGQAYLEQGNFDKALKQFKDAEPKFDDALADSAVMGQGYCLEEKKKLDEALDRYKKAKINNNGFETIAVLDEARIYKEKGQKDEALKAFNKYLDMEPQSPFLDYIRYLVLNLSS